MATTRRKTGPGVHAHGCVVCKGRYEDACDAANENGKCSYCTYGHGWDLLRDNKLPKDCCKIHSRPVKVDKQMNLDEFKQYKLSRSIAWFKCDLCSRTHPYVNPTPTGHYTAPDPNIRRG